MPENKQLFPKDFLWGASTAGHQVDGGLYDQWSVWELAHAAELAKTAKRRLGWLPNWPEIKKQAEDPNNYVSGLGVEHFKRYEADFDLLTKLNLNAFRFSIEWSRLEPQPGQWNQEAFDHYKRYIAALRRRHIEPMLNLWHWTLPVWFAEAGGFEKRANLRYWRRFVQKVADELLDGVTYIITINEPNVYATFGYYTGEHPPQKKSLMLLWKVYWHLTIAHRQAYRILKRTKPQTQVGLASQLANIQAKRPHNLLDEFVTKYMRYFWNWWFLRRTRHQQDFLGFNYYFTDYYRFTNALKPVNPSVPLNDLGWYMEPEGLYPILLRAWSRYKKPIIVTENGVADAHDQYRQWWLEETLIAMQRAVSEGVHLRGYFHWSLLDNFEWAYGWWPKFGLVAVDRDHGMKRNPRPSAHWLADKIAELHE